MGPFGSVLKRYVVIFPIHQLNYYNAYPETKLLNIKIILNLFLFFNIAMVGVGELLIKRWVRKANGFLLLLTAFCTPFQLVQGTVSKSFGFKNNILWQFNNLFLLTNMYLFSESIGNAIFPLLYSITIPVIMSIVTKDSTFWTLHRVQSIFTLLLIDSVFPRFHDNFHIETSEIKKQIGFLEKPLLLFSLFPTGLMVFNKMKKIIN